MQAWEYAIVRVCKRDSIVGTQFVALICLQKDHKFRNNQWIDQRGNVLEYVSLFEDKLKKLTW